MAPRLFSYQGSHTVSKIGAFLVRHFTFGPNYVTVRSKYGLLLIPKDFRALTMRFDLLEPEIKPYLEIFMREADWFIDIGASEGYYLLKAKKICPQARMMGIEPDNMARSILLANLAMNRLSDSTIVSDRAISDEDGKTIPVRTCVGPDFVAPTSTTLDSLLAQFSVQLTSKSLIVVDTEGAGVRVLKGAQRSLGVGPRIVMELHPGEEDAKGMLETIGYKVTKPSPFFLIAQH